MVKLGHASQAEQDAAVKVVHRDIANLIERFMSSGMASMFKGQAVQKLESPEGKALTIALVDHALDAAEAVRNAQQPVQQQPPTPAAPPGTAQTAMPELKFGMREWRDDAIKLTFGNYLVHTKLPNVPRMFGHVRGSPRGGWDILGNATYGDCVLAGAAHETMVWAMATKRKLPSFDTATVVKQYMELAGGQDTGLDPIATAKWRCTTGLTDAEGTVHKTRAFAAVELDDIAIAAYLFGVCGLGLMLPESADDDFGKGYVWNDLKSEPKNGHYIPVVGRNSMGNFIVVTWGRLQAATPAYIKRYFAGAVCYYSLEYLLDSGLSPEAIDTAQLDADLTTLGELMIVASQRDYNVGSAAALRVFQSRMAELVNANALELLARAIIDAVDADREKQKQERDN